MTEVDKKLVIRNATMEDLFEVAAVEAECFPVSEAATEAEFRERIACYGGHFWLLFEDERLVSFVDGMVTDQEDLTDEMYERACVTVFQRDSGREEKACLTKTRQRSPGRVGYESSCVCSAAVQVTEKQAVRSG